ncbi:glycosyltransferase family 61 protein [Niveibacterium sp. SC-1]|uniref:glycosyltransferase family 61 protein n=1 Tax=Niveibacterium sp. SC-1 TaxID=3135646 RepID=UPI00311EE482
MKLVSLEDVATGVETILPPISWQAPRVCNLSNIREVAGRWGAFMYEQTYAAQTKSIGAVRFGRLPRDMRLNSGGYYLPTGPDFSLLDHAHPRFRADPTLIDEHVAAAGPVEHISGECLLVARFGIQTWGHWLGEMLPKLVVAERCFPGRFRYVLHRSVFSSPGRRSIWSSIGESLQAYGVGRERIAPVVAEKSYSFEALFAMSPIYWEGAFHPGALDWMRADVQIRSTEFNRRCAFFRRDSNLRSLANHERLADILSACGFELCEPGLMSFPDQVRMFQSSSKVCGVLGSGLSGLIYSPAGVQVISLAPARFGDRFFHAMVQERNGQFVDLRGETVAEGEVLGKDGSFNIDPAILHDALLS